MVGAVGTTSGASVVVGSMVSVVMSTSWAAVAGMATLPTWHRDLGLNQAESRIPGACGQAMVSEEGQSSHPAVQMSALQHLRRLELEAEGPELARHSGRHIHVPRNYLSRRPIMYLGTLYQLGIFFACRSGEVRALPRYLLDHR